jgi:hypothetical protein
MPGTRPATIGDLDSLLLLGKNLHAESIFQKIPIDANKLKSFMVAFVAGSSNICIVHENAAATIDGMLLGYVKPYFFSNELGAWDVALYVRPERRGTMIAFQLWRAYKRRATELRARTLWSGTSAGIAPDRTRRFFTGMGMVEVGALYRMSLEPTKK